MWCRVALVRTVVSEELIAFVIRVERMSKPGTALAVTSYCLYRTYMKAGDKKRGLKNKRAVFMKLNSV
jgi:hypothetical protein